MKIHIACLTYLFLLLLPGFQANAQADSPLTLNDSQGNYLLGKFISVFEDPSGKLTIDDVSQATYLERYKTFNTDSPSVGVSRSAFWIRLNLKNESRNTNQWILDQRFANTHYLDLYIPDKNGEGFSVKESGNLRPYSLRDIPHRRILFNLPLEYGQETVVYLRLQTQTMVGMDIQLWSKAAFEKADRVETYLQSMTHGFVLMIIIINLFLFIFFPKRSYLYLVVLVATGGTMFSFYEGFAQQLFPDHLAETSQYFLHSLMAICMIMLLLYTNDNFVKPLRSVLINRINLTLIFIWSVLFVSKFLTDYITVNILTIPIEIITPLYLFVVGVVSWRHHNTSARYLVFGLLIIFLGVIYLYLSRFGFIESNLFSDHVLKLSLVICMLFLSLGIIDHMQFLQQAQNKSLENLQKSETLFHELTDNINEVFWIGSPDWKELIYISPAYEQKWGFDEAQLYKGFDAWMTAIHDDDREQVIAQIPDDLSAIGEVVDFKEYRMTNKKGDTLWVKVQAYPIRDNEGNINRIAGIAEDVSSRKKMEFVLQENQYNLIKAQEIAKIGSWKYIPETKMFECSKELFSLYEVTGEKITLDFITNSIHPEDKEKIVKIIQNGLKDHVPWEVDHRVLLSNKVVKWVHFVGEPQVNADGNVISINCVVQDITNKKESEETIRRTQKMDALGKLTGGISHDYNNMLGVIIGYSELLNMDLKDDSKLSGYVKEIQRAAERGSKLTKKLLAFSKHALADAEKINVNVLLREYQLMLEKTLTVRIKLRLDLEENLWPVWIDSGDFEDSIINMCINSMHAISDQGVVTIQTCNKAIDEQSALAINIRPGEYVVLSIIDDGSGINESKLDKIFDPFYSTKGDLGTGLGLSQVYGFVKRSAGDIKVSSIPGKETCFALYFPRYVGAEHKDVKFDDDPFWQTNSDERILLVDDEPALLKLNKKILSRKGYTVFCANSGKEALDILNNELVDLLITDIVMPEMEGYELASIVKEKYPNQEILFMSGFASEGKSNMPLDTSAQNILQKPFTSTTLLKRVREIFSDLVVGAS